ncbi:hypothetical protein EV182_008100, partial [Spiromyces aspiralis]
PGDLVEVRQGGVLNWDGVLIRGNLAIDESQMTGPPEIHFKRRESEWLFQFDDIRSFTPISLLGQGLLFDKISTDLRRLGIYYSRIHRILVAGKVNVVAFDKTGTLTNGQMELHMVIPT